MLPEEIATLTLIREHESSLVTAMEISRRVGLTPSAVLNWQTRDKELSQRALVNCAGRKLFWWPAVKDWLIERDITFCEPAMPSAEPHVCAKCDAIIRPGELEIRAGAPGSAGSFRHFEKDDCSMARLRRRRS